MDYPHMLITTSLSDNRVLFDEPAKFTAKLRDYKTDNNLLLLKTEMNAGHGGKSGRDGAIEEIALDYAFALKITKKFDIPILKLKKVLTLFVGAFPQVLNIKNNHLIQNQLP